MSSNTSGMFVALEGGEGAGKSSLIRLLHDKISSRFPELEVVITREPGNSSIGQSVRDLLLHNSGKVIPQAEALLFAAERAQHVHEIIKPALDRGALVICDRFTGSSVAYQGVARGLGAEEVSSISAFATGGLTPNRTYILDVDPRIGLARKHDQKELNSMETESLEFHYRVREAFLELSRQPNALLIDANNDLENSAYLCTLDIVKLLSS